MGCSELQRTAAHVPGRLPKLNTRVRFPSSAPQIQRRWRAFPFTETPSCFHADAANTPRGGLQTQALMQSLCVPQSRARPQRRPYSTGTSHQALEDRISEFCSSSMPSDWSCPGLNRCPLRALSGECCRPRSRWSPVPRFVCRPSVIRARLPTDGVGNCFCSGTARLSVFNTDLP